MPIALHRALTFAWALWLVVRLVAWARWGWAQSIVVRGRTRLLAPRSRTLPRRSMDR